MTRLLFIAALLLSACSNGPCVKLEVSNPSGLPRNGEVVETDFNTVRSSLRLKEGDKVVVTDNAGKQVAYQITHDNKLIFPVTVEGKGKATFNVAIGEPETFPALAYGRFVPERKDDYAWENNVGGFRIYGPALKPVDGPSNGVDVWSKRTPELIIDKWYKLAAEGKDYHTDRGEGQDCYKVGRTLGAGMPAPILNDTLVLGENFAGWERLDNGPLRTTVRFTYSPLKVGDAEVIETREISLDANTPFCKMTATYQGAPDPLAIAAGITLHTNKGTKEMLTDQNATLYWEKQDKEYGVIGTAVVVPQTVSARLAEQCNHLCALTSVKPGEPLVYYFGAGWDKFLHPTLESWRNAVTEQATKVNQPLVVSQLFTP